MILLKNNFFTTSWKILKEAVIRFTSEDTLTQSAALAYYTVFSLPPMLFIIFWSAGLIYDESIVRTAVFAEFGELIGKDGSNQLMSTIERLELQKPSWWKSMIGVGMMLITASTVFVAMQNALNKIFEVEEKRSLKQNIWVMVRNRLMSISMIAIIAFIMAVSLVFTTIINNSGKAIESWLGNSAKLIVYFNSMLLNIGFLTVLFALMFRYLPDIKMKLRNTWLGAFLTALLFLCGKLLIEFFIGNSQVANFYDAAGSILVLMLWVYFTSAIFLFGATITYCRATQFKE